MDTTDVLMTRTTRVVAYKVYAWLTVLLGGVLAGCAAVNIAAPTALVAVLAGLNFVGGALGFIAAANVTPAPTVEPAIEFDEIDGDGDDYFDGDLATVTPIGTRYADELAA